MRNTKINWDRFSTLHRSLWRIAPLQCCSLIVHIEFALSVQRGSLNPTSAQLVKGVGGKEKRDPAFCFLWGGVKDAAHYVKLLFIAHDHGIWVQGKVHLVTQKKKELNLKWKHVGYQETIGIFLPFLIS